MGFYSSSQVSLELNSTTAATEAARQLKEAFAAEPLRAVLVYATVNHDQATIVRVLRAQFGPDILLLGCSAQGLSYGGGIKEGGYALGLMGLGGDQLEVAAAFEREIESETLAKGKSLGRRIKARLGKEPNLVIVLYDPLCGADVEQLLAGLQHEVNAPLIGGGASQPHGPIIRTYQYWGDEVVGHGAIALGLAGPFSVEMGVCHGTSPTGVVMTLTRCQGNNVLEIDGRPAIDIWREVTGCEGDQVNDQDYVSNWAIGVQRKVLSAEGKMEAQYFIRAAFGFDLQTGAVILQAAIPEGTSIMFHHRTVAAVTEGTNAMGRELGARLKGRNPWAVLTFECGARTGPLLGAQGTLEENLALQSLVAPRAPWLGMMAWGEIAPIGGAPAFHNYTFPLVVLAT